MKKITQGLSLFALLIAITAAFAFKPAETKSSAGTVYHWFDPTGVGYLGDNTIDDEKMESDCFEDGNGCENAYLSSQLIDPNDPSQGVKESELSNPAVEIRQ